MVIFSTYFPLAIFWGKKDNFYAFFLEKKASFLAIYLHLNENLPEGQSYTIHRRASFPTKTPKFVGHFLIYQFCVNSALFSGRHLGCQI